ncbi:hypothetical protein SAMN06265222_105252 [Neorhodopirellula lusitana]|uniref:Uncharacterized protein n=1 Tax=Neorhodopirellula lusitana TaxID=445327 RepID=A0ABY1Q271_9BACT|nr:hypothetical protein [Neorhodopirellula lusitana]SMP57045.1 hypothetical protein SAMN06265222_105252 [Neorhodopirellula lusitana]
MQHRKRKRFLKWSLGLLGVAMVLSIAVGASTWWIWSQSRQVPEFYTRARNQSGPVGEIARNTLQLDVDRARDEAARRMFWNASFSEEEINAWMQAELPDRFKRLSTRGVSAPAIAIENGQLFAAARYRSKRWDTVVSCKLSVEMTEEPNMLAIALSDLKAGALPLPLEPFVRRISKEAAMGDLDIRWDFTDRGPIALVTVPKDEPRFIFQPLVIESIRLVAGQLQLGGRAGTEAPVEYSPRGSVHQFVSYRNQNDDIQTR